MTSRLQDRIQQLRRALVAGLRRALRAVQGLATGIVRLQTLIGIALLYFAVAELWRPAGALLVIGALLVLEEVVTVCRVGRK